MNCIAKLVMFCQNNMRFGSFLSKVQQSRCKVLVNLHQNDLGCAEKFVELSFMFTIREL